MQSSGLNNPPRLKLAASLPHLPRSRPKRAAPMIPANDDSAPVIKSEVRVVLVDSVVTDKKGNYIRDLTAKDFRVWEDNKEQRITSFSMGDDPAAPDYSQKKYMVLFFDTSTRDFLNQVRRAASGSEVYRCQCRPQPADGGRRFRQRTPGRAKLHLRCRSPQKSSRGSAATRLSQG